MDDPKVKKIKKENTDKLKRHVWKSSEDKILLNILKEQTNHGGKEGTSFTKKAWRDILEQFNESRVDKLELQQLKNRHKYYRSCYATMDRLLKLTGFGWDDDDKMIKASEETWEELIEVSLCAYD
jgi:plasmid replication initiation protein